MPEVDVQLHSFVVGDACKSTTHVRRATRGTSCGLGLELRTTNRRLLSHKHVGKRFDQFPRIDPNSGQVLCNGYCAVVLGTIIHLRLQVLVKCFDGHVVCFWGGDRCDQHPRSLIHGLPCPRTYSEYHALFFEIHREAYCRLQDFHAVYDGSQRLGRRHFNLDLPISHTRVNTQSLMHELVPVGR